MNGVVFTKNVVNSKMRSRIDNPAIMLLATPLEYQRGHHKFASIDPVSCMKVIDTLCEKVTESHDYHSIRRLW